MKIEGLRGFDRIQHSAFVDEHADLVARDSRIARTGVQTYLARELGLHKVIDSIRPNDMVRLYRPPEQVFKQSAMDSFQLVPLTLEHPVDALVTEDNWQAVVVGTVRDAKQSGEYVTATVTVSSRDAKAAVRAGKIGLSAGYSFDLDFTSGVSPSGEAYDGIQTNIYGNHVALVSKARCGAACRIGDTENDSHGGEVMADKKIVVNGITIEVSEMAAQVIEQGVKVGNDSIEKLTKELADAQTALTAKDAELAEAKKAIPTAEQIDGMVNDRLQTMATAQKLAPSVAVDGQTSEQIHRAVVIEVTGKDEDMAAIAAAIVGTDDYKTADAAKVKMAFVAISAAAKGKTLNAGDDAAAVALAAKNGGGAKESKPVGRARMMQGMRSGFAK